MGDVVDPGAHGPLDALGAVGVGGRPPAQTVGLVEEDPQLLGGELGEPGGGAIGHEAAGGHHLDRVSAHEVVVADLAADLVRGVRGAPGVVGMPTGRGDLRPGGDDPGPAQVSGVDGVAQGDVDVVARPEGLDAGDALAEQLAGGAGGVEGEAGNLMGSVVGVLDVGAGGGQVVVGLDEPGHEGGAGQIHAYDVVGVDVGKELTQASLELGGRSDGQDVPPPQEDGTALAGPTRLGDLGLARATGPDSDGLKAALHLAAPTGENAVGTHQGGRAPVEALTTVGGWSRPAGGLRVGSGGLSGVIGHS